jgi:hypothetical protein
VSEMNGSVTIALPNGFSVEGAHSREAGLRELTGEEQITVAEDLRALPAAAWTTEVLARCVTRLSSLAKLDRSALRALTVGDRDALLLHLHQISFGESIQCEARCPAEGCAEKLELTLLVKELLLPAYPHAGREHELRVTDAAGTQAEVRFRLPTGEDQEAAAALASTDVAAAVAALLRRCVLSVEPAELTDAVSTALSERMAELDPQAELLLNARCPACGRAFRARFDVAGFLRQRLEERTQALYREVHLLAFHYHWSERDILAMNSRTRQRYLRLLATELTQGSLQ